MVAVILLQWLFMCHPLSGMPVSVAVASLFNVVDIDQNGLYDRLCRRPACKEAP